MTRRSACRSRSTIPTEVGARRRSRTKPRRGSPRLRPRRPRRAAARRPARLSSAACGGAPSRTRRPTLESGIRRELEPPGSVLVSTKRRCGTGPAADDEVTGSRIGLPPIAGSVRSEESFELTPADAWTRRDVSCGAPPAGLREAGSADDRQHDAIEAANLDTLWAVWSLDRHAGPAISSTHLQAPEPQVRPISVSDGAAPDLVDPVGAFRQWRLSEGALWSLYSGVRWSTAELRATCSEGRHDPTLAPSKGCSCGIYADYEPRPRSWRRPVRRTSCRAPWCCGAKVVHASGMRAEHARIVGLEQPLTSGGKQRQLDTVAAQLSVPVVPHSRLAAVAMAHGLPLDPCLRPAPSGRSGSAESLEMAPIAAALLIVLVGYGLKARSRRGHRGRIGRSRRAVADAADRVHGCSAAM